MCLPQACSAQFSYHTVPHAQVYLKKIRVTEIQCDVIGPTQVGSDGICPTTGCPDQAHSPLLSAIEICFSICNLCLPRIPGIYSSLEKIEMVLVYYASSC